jgi:hypothetical protein
MFSDSSTSRRAGSSGSYVIRETLSVSPAHQSGVQHWHQSIDPSSSTPYIHDQAHTRARKHTRPFRPQDTYPTPPSSPDLDENEITLVASSDSPKTTLVTSIRGSETFCESKDTLPHRPQTLQYSQHRTTPAIPISLLLNTPHRLPHGAPFTLTQPSGILSVLGGNRVLHIEGTGRILDRMPYSPALTNGVILTRDQAEEENVEGMLGGGSTTSESSGPMSPDQSYVLLSHTEISADIQSRIVHLCSPTYTRQGRAPRRSSVWSTWSIAISRSFASNISSWQSHG